MICLCCGKEHDGSFGSGKYCSISCANKQIHSDETKLKISKGVKTSELFKENNIKAIKYRNLIHGYGQLYCKECGKLIIDYNSRQYCSDSCKEKWLNINWKPKLGGYRKGSGIGKSGWYKGIHCDSSWELAFVIYHLEHNLYIERCKEKRTYIFENEQRTYIPDFITNDGIIEIKGYKTAQSIAKHNANMDITVLYKSDMEIYLNYVICKYGADFIKLYE